MTLQNRNSLQRFWLISACFVFGWSGLVGCGSGTSGNSVALPGLDQSTDVAGDEVEAQTDEMILSKAGRQFLWDVEHVAFEMETNNLPEMKQALANSKWDLLRKYLAEGFEAEVPAAEWAKMVDSPVVDVQRQTLDKPGTKMNAEQFVSFLMEIRDELDLEGCKAKIGLVRLGPKDHRTFEDEWYGLWRTRLWGTRDGHPLEFQLMLEVDLVPLTSDVAQQVQIIRAAKVVSIERRETEHDLLVDVTADTGINTRDMYDFWRLPSEMFAGSSGGVYLCDYDDDGHVDALIDDRRRGTILYRGLGDFKFEEANRQAGIPADIGYPGGPTWADFDGDGDEDLICGKHLFSNNGDGTFEDVTRQSNLSKDMVDAAGRVIHDGNGELCLAGYSALAVADYDGDGLVDIYESHAHGASYKQRTEGLTVEKKKMLRWIDGGFGNYNVLWRNKGNWQFEDVTDSAGAAGNGGAAFTSLWFDANDDLYPDVLSINEFGVNAMLINNQDGTFTNTSIDPIFGGWSMGAAAGDYDNDGDTDIYIANMYSKAGNRVISNVAPDEYPAEIYEKIYNGTLGNKLYTNRGDGTFDVASHDPVLAERGWTYGPDFVDLNGDGLLDLYTTAGFKSEKRGDPDG
ncbi:MAG: VCBS repeat-containing protein [Pirellulaceae bacterium]|nr:VCBS repeat-containing protein [Pirellulaceae bacterium]